MIGSSNYLKANQDLKEKKKTVNLISRLGGYLIGCLEYNLIVNWYSVLKCDLKTGSVVFKRSNEFLQIG